MAVYLQRRTAFKVLAAVGVFQLLTRKTLRSEEVPLAIKGYDPVAYFTDGKPVEGSPQYETDWDNHRYRFASAEHLAQFRADPSHYAPQFGNACTTSLSGGKFVEADPQAWTIHDDKLYMFGGVAGVPIFEKDPAGYINKAAQNRSAIPKGS
jgi:YHS domain-containing protein